MMEEKFVKLKPETVSGRRVDFYERYIKNKKGEWKKVMVVANVEGIKTGKDKYFTGGDTKKGVMRRLEFLIRGALDRQEKEQRFHASLKHKFPSMRRFYYKVIRDNPARYGGSNVTVEVLEHKPDGMKYLGETRWNTASYKGQESEVLDYLKKEGVVPKGMFPDGYYSWREAEEYNMKISRL